MFVQTAVCGRPHVRWCERERRSYRFSLSTRFRRTSPSSSSRTGSPSCCCQGSFPFLTSTVLSRISSGLPDKSASDTAIPGPNGGPCCRCTEISCASHQACPLPSSWMGFLISNRKVSRHCRSLSREKNMPFPNCI